MEVVLEDGFCDRPADVLEQKCRDLQEKSWKNSNCCIWGRPNTELEDPGNDPITNPEGCYHGDETGAKFNNSQLNLDYWYYKGKDRDYITQKNAVQIKSGKYDSTISFEHLWIPLFHTETS